MQHRASLVVVHKLRCPVACGILAPQPGINLASLALEGGVLTTEPPGKSPEATLNLLIQHIFYYVPTLSLVFSGPGDIAENKIGETLAPMKLPL